MFSGIKQCIAVWLLAGCLAEAYALTAVGHDSRVDLQWETSAASGLTGYAVYRAETAKGLYIRLNAKPWPIGIYSDFVGKNGKVYHYRVSRLFRNGGEQKLPDGSVSARSRKMDAAELTASIQAATFRYFWDYAHPVSGLIRERYHDVGKECTAGGTGFGFMAIMVGVERGFITREAGAKRVLKMVRFLEQKTPRFHGAWSHWVDGASGEVIRFSEKDDGADLVETALLMQGMLAARQYFDRNNAVEKEFRETVTRLWEAVEWDWFLKDQKLQWHWSPNHGFDGTFPIRGYNECMITYLLAIASPTHSIPASTYYEGWASPETYAHGETYYGIEQPVGPPMGGPLFLSHYSFLGFDPRGRRDRFCNYFENARAISLIQRAYCIENPSGFKGFGQNVWGLTAGYTPDGYRACAPGEKHDNGTIAPTAALGSMPFTPRESLAAMLHYYHQLGDRLWGPFGFYDSFNLERDWFSDGYLAIDQGPIIIMIENARTGLCWNYFMKNPEIQPMLDAIGWKTEQ